jgi:23S rRNA pseudouridine955/2504/2580 synthase/23S rRNA pseudouridine1911/1915/1917 synthase
VTQPKRRWIVDIEHALLGEIVERMDGGGRQAVAQGRVFVDAQRIADPGHVLQRGARVEIYAERRVQGEVQILAEHTGLVAVYKPALLATEPDKSGADLTLLSEAARLLGCPVQELHALSRLDVGVSGVVLLARRRSQARVEPPRAHRRRYVAIAEAAPEEPRGSWTSAIERGARGPQAAETRYAVARALSASGVSAGPARPALAPALLALAPATGRGHQLRIHAARAGAALLGDRAHGGSARLLAADGHVIELQRVALHAVSIVVTPATGAAFQARAPAPLELLQLWQDLGGEDSDFGRAEQENLADKPGGVA